eukprot:gene273-biopygen5114
MVFMLNWLIRAGFFRKIRWQFMITGHSFTDCDRHGRRLTRALDAQERWIGLAEMVTIIKRAAIARRGDATPLDIASVSRDAFWDIAKFTAREYPSPDTNPKKKGCWKEDADGRPILIVKDSADGRAKCVTY